MAAATAPTGIPASKPYVTELPPEILRLMELGAALRQVDPVASVVAQVQDYNGTTQEIGKAALRKLITDGNEEAVQSLHANFVNKQDTDFAEIAVSPEVFPRLMEVARDKESVFAALISSLTVQHQDPSFGANITGAFREFESLRYRAGLITLLSSGRSFDPNLVGTLIEAEGPLNDSGCVDSLIATARGGRNGIEVAHRLLKKESPVVVSKLDISRPNEAEIVVAIAEASAPDVRLVVPLMGIGGSNKEAALAQLQRICKSDGRCLLKFDEELGSDSIVPDKRFAALQVAEKMGEKDPEFLAGCTRGIILATARSAGQPEAEKGGKLLDVIEARAIPTYFVLYSLNRSDLPNEQIAKDAAAQISKLKPPPIEELLVAAQPLTDERHKTLLAAVFSAVKPEDAPAWADALYKYLMIGERSKDEGREIPLHSTTSGETENVTPTSPLASAYLRQLSEAMRVSDDSLVIRKTCYLLHLFPLPETGRVVAHKIENVSDDQLRDERIAMPLARLARKLGGENVDASLAGVLGRELDKDTPSEFKTRYILEIAARLTAQGSQHMDTLGTALHHDQAKTWAIEEARKVGESQPARRQPSQD